MKKQMILMVAVALVLTACGKGPEETGKAAVETQAADSKSKSAMDTAAVAVSEAADGAALYGPCAGCHGVDGKSKALGVGAIIAGQSKDDLMMKIKGYKDGSYGGQMKGSMTAMVTNLNDDQIAAVAEYISGL